MENYGLSRAELEAVMAIEHAGLTPAEVAQAMRIPVATVIRAAQKADRLPRKVRQYLLGL